MIGKTISHYQITEKIGEGGMGVVYKARDTHLDRFVAIKVLPTEKVANPDRKARFVREARSASALNHPNIVHVYDIDQQDGMDFMAMEFVAGKTLGHLIPRKGMPINEALRIAVQVADALAAAHEIGIVHRDLKPGNILVGDDGRVRVLDFGLAKLSEALPESDETRTAAGETPQTEEGTILGTASYMSPEQAEGRVVDPRSDIFSFGSVFYEMVTGRRAFQGDSRMSTLAAIIKGEPKAVREIVENVPGEVERIVRHCLRKDLRRRLQHMDDVRSLLEELKEESDSGRLTAATPDVPRVKGRRVASVVGGVAVILMVAAGSYWFERSRQRVEEAPLVAVPLTSYPGNELTPALSPDGNHVAFSWDGETQDNYDIYVQVIGTGGTVRLTSDPAFDWAPAWSPDGREIRFYRYWREGKFAVVSVPPLPGRERTLREYPFPPELPRDVLLFAAPAWSPDGKCTAHPGETGLVLRPGNSTAHTVADLPGGSELFPSFAPDGRSLAFVYQTGGANTDLYLLPLTPDFQADGKPKRLTSGMRFINRPVWKPDGNEMIFSAATETGMGLWRIEASGASPPRRLVMAGGDAWFPSISRDGRRLVYERRTENSSIWRVGLGPQSRAAAKIISSTRVDGLPSYSPDGTKIAFSSYRSGSLEIWMANADGSSPVQLTSLGQYSVVPEWSPDGKWIVFQSSGETGNHLYVVGAEGGGLRRLSDDPHDALQPSWSPDGKWIYFMSDRSGTHQIWRVPPQGGEALQVTRNGGEFARVSPDGSELYFTRGAYGSHQLWKIPVTGGAETRMKAPPVYDWGFAIARERLYFATLPGEGTYPIVALDLSTGKTQEVAWIAYSPFAKFSVSPDGQWLVYDQQEQSNSDLVLVENLR